MLIGTSPKEFRSAAIKLRADSPDKAMKESEEKREAHLKRQAARNSKKASPKLVNFLRQHAENSKPKTKRPSPLT